ncbi:hypothetical protein CVD25_02345 [Bacillus canaveralius]|uniref:Uncharacterized protein n=1 Tax=Bacillus canaveralius TaxID=1403243 RepID=A0A2N5GP88_9BACI|nr:MULTISPECIES: hypothetical protein [Bacillus]PLR84390.1 hypothetical protein CU635_06450 [Bacillus canaveralius]PLR87026.1 hypothetical protein CVD23_05185 [Bacillus sp. V33-4]PLS00608.1 hypothetical protein CVD25_02345 [Bacillus canaveralius]RSK57895.1 hypothetical protein EJA13_00560 [Bacillus canaveralius]
MFTTIPPKGDYTAFNSEDEYISKTKAWGLISASAKSAKHEFLYKRENATYKVIIEGYDTNGSHETAIVSFANGALHCVHPAYLKEMQSPSFGKDSVFNSEAEPTANEVPVSGAAVPPAVEVPISGDAQQSNSKKANNKKDAKEKKQKAVLDLPADKVSFEAVVKEFTTKYNHFTESEDEILVLEKVKIVGDNALEIGEAWCGYSNTLKKSELETGDSITFNAKIVDKKLNKDIRYKINNPSKITKQS